MSRLEITLAFRMRCSRFSPGHGTQKSNGWPGFEQLRSSLEPLFLPHFEKAEPATFLQELQQRLLQLSNSWLPNLLWAAMERRTLKSTRLVAKAPRQLASARLGRSPKARQRYSAGQTRRWSSAGRLGMMPKSDASGIPQRRLSSSTWLPQPPRTSVLTRPLLCSRNCRFRVDTEKDSVDARFRKESLVDARKQNSSAAEAALPGSNAEVTRSENERRLAVERVSKKAVEAQRPQGGAASD